MAEKTDLKVGAFLKNGDNKIEIRVMSIMGNYLKSLKHTPVPGIGQMKDNSTDSINGIGMTCYRLLKSKTFQCL